MNEKIICSLSAAPMRKEPSDKAEMVNQIVYGETAKLLDENEKWYMIQLDHDQYEGWIDKKQVKVIPEVKSPVYPIRKIFENQAGRIIPCGGLVEDQTAIPSNAINFMNELIVDFLGSPYLWGGRTFMGIDCSGFTQMVFRSIGKSLPRDAYQQAEKGSTIAFIEECMPGDLAFFDNADGRITHVGIITNKDSQGRLQIAHASGEVRMDYLDHQGIFNQDKGVYSHNLRLLKRL
ncbi:MAG: NlpC/P60 family protein [Flavobacteriales bacterium]